MTSLRTEASRSGSWVADPSRAAAGIGFFLELVMPSIERFETIHYLAVAFGLSIIVLAKVMFIV